VTMPVIVRMAVSVIVPMFVDRLDTRSHRDLRFGLRIELLADQQHQGRPEEREQRNKPDLI